MLSRRAFLAALAAVLASPAAARNAGPAVHPALQRYGDLFILDGWVLNRRDLERLGVDVA